MERRDAGSFAVLRVAVGLIYNSELAPIISRVDGWADSSASQDQKFIRGSMRHDNFDGANLEQIEYFA